MVLQAVLPGIVMRQLASCAKTILRFGDVENLSIHNLLSLYVLSIPYPTT
jgi:hypothetical protein